MKIIDLYYKIVMKEELPKQVKYKNKVYCYDDEIELNPYVSREGTYSEYLIGATLYKCPADEIEIIEEEKQIEELKELPMILGNDINDEIARNRYMINVLVRELNKIKKEGK